MRRLVLMALLYQLRNERGRLWVIIFGKSRNKRDDTGFLIEINGRWDLEIYLGMLHEKDIYLVKLWTLTSLDMLRMLLVNFRYFR